MQKCRRCQEYLAVELFRVRSDTGKRRQVCRGCENTENLKRYHGSPSTRSAHREAAHRYTLKQKGLTKDQFDAMREAQDCRCGICGAHETETRFGILSVDHCHTTGKVRSLLCHNCNVGIGFFQEDPAIIRRAIAYIEVNRNVQ